MPTKDFEQVIQFIGAQRPNGQAIWLPLVQVALVTPEGSRISLPLLFDTGASVTTLRKELYYLLGLQSWDQGERIEVATAGGVATAYLYSATLEFLGKTIECPIHLAELPPNPLFNGLFGREGVFDHFGFGFWESVHELYVTINP